MRGSAAESPVRPIHQLSPSSRSGIGRMPIWALPSATAWITWPGDRQGVMVVVVP